MEKFNCVTLSWPEVHKITKKTAQSIKQSNFHPDVVIGISRGGLVPARLFCDFLHVKSCFTVKVDHWGVTATKDGEAKLTHPLQKDLSGLHVLLVDDITDTGQSIELAKQHILLKNPASLKTVTLYHLKGSKYNPDYFGEERGWAWLIFPWNYMEDLVNIMRGILKEHPKDVEKIKEELKINFNIIIDISEVEEMLMHIAYLDELH